MTNEAAQESISWGAPGQPNQVEMAELTVRSVPSPASSTATDPPLQPGSVVTITLGMRELIDGSEVSHVDLTLRCLDHDHHPLPRTTSTGG